MKFLADEMTTLENHRARYPRLFVLTGADCITHSRIPNYRDETEGPPVVLPTRRPGPRREPHVNGFGEGLR